MTKKIKIPNTELTLYPLGLGTVNAGLAWDEKRVDEICGTFLENGGNLIDTAHVYGDWVPGKKSCSERAIGDWIKRNGKRNHVILMTKGGHPDLLTAHPDMHKSRMGRADMKADLEDSLKQLQTDVIDLYFYHRDDESQRVEELIEVMEEFRQQGKIRYYACSNWSTKRMLAADIYCRSKGYRGFVANQALLNAGSDCLGTLWDDTMKKADEEMRQYHKQRPENLLMPYMGACGGFFHKLLQGDERVREMPFYTPENVEMGENIRKICGQMGITVTQVLLGYFQTLDFPVVPLYGPKDARQLLEAMQVGKMEFGKEEYEV